MPLTKDLGQFVADLSPNRLPEEAVRVARMGIIDMHRHDDRRPQGRLRRAS